MLTRSHPLSYCSNGCSVTLALFRDVKNCAQLKSQASTGRIPASLLDTALVSCKSVSEHLLSCPLEKSAQYF